MQRRAQPIKIPLFVRMRSAAWGTGGSGFGQYLAALIDRHDLADARVLGIDGNADLLLGLVNGSWSVESFVAVEPDLVTAAFFASHLEGRNIHLIVTDLDDRRDETIAAIAEHAPFDIVVVRTDPARMTFDHLAMLLHSLSSGVTADAKLVVTLALAVTTLAGRGAGDRLADRGLLDTVGDYLEYEWELGMIPVYSPDRVRAIAANHGWRVDDICEPRRGFQQHHLVLSRAAA
jgi:hypothetical protein